jgi:ABC-type nitrate/sulfonate/bicarbonate transport system permease component
MTASPAMSATTAPARPSFFASDAFKRIAAGVVILLLWEILVRATAPAYVAKPSGIIAVIPSVLSDPAFLRATGATMLAVVEGLAIAIALGTVIGLAMGRSLFAERFFRHYVNGFYAVPMIVVLPLMSLWFGYTGAARLATIVFAATFSIIINLADGAKAVSKDYLEVAHSYRSSGWRTLIDIVLPSSTPYFLAGLRLAAGRALIGAVVAEFFTAIGGIGYFILYNSRTFHHNEAFVGVLLLAGFGVAFELSVNYGIRKFLPWYRRDDRTD